MILLLDIGVGVKEYGIGIQYGVMDNRKIKIEWLQNRKTEDWTKPISPWINIPNNFVDITYYHIYHPLPISIKSKQVKGNNKRPFNKEKDQKGQLVSVIDAVSESLALKLLNSSNIILYQL